MRCTEVADRPLPNGKFTRRDIGDRGRSSTTLHMIYQLPVWLLFLALALPLSLIAMSARQAAIAIVNEPNANPETIHEGPLTYNEDGSRTQAFSVQIPVSRSVAVTQSFGPISISANGRLWAANVVLIGLGFVFVGLIGLFHFPTVSHIGSRSDEIQAEAIEEPSV